MKEKGIGRTYRKHKREIKNAYRILVSKPEDKWPFGCSNGKWVDDDDDDNDDGDYDDDNNNMGVKQIKNARFISVRTRTSDCP